MQISIKNAAVAAVALLSTAVAANAATLQLNAYSNVTGNADTRLAGSTLDTNETVDGTNLLVRLQTTETGNPAGTNQEKVAPFFSTGTFPTPIGTLGDLGRGGLTVDWLLGSRGSTTPSFVGNIAAFRLLVGRPDVSPTATAEIIWETGYQSTAPTFDAGTGYDNVDIGSGKFYSRYGGANYGEGSGGPVNPLTLTQLAAGEKLTTAAYAFGDATPVYGLAVSIGSDSGDYTAYVGDIRASFVAVPEPTAIAALSGVALVALRRRRGA